VFTNLFENAIEAMRSGGVISIRGEADGDSIMVRVDDTGPGISAALRGRLFQPFVTAGKKNGLGLGLALSRQTLLDHGGDIWADDGTDRDSGGARFWLRLPKNRSTVTHEAAVLNGAG
jgi:two-component system, NtrC family, sensor kinase